MNENVKREPIPLGMAYMTDTEVVIVGHPLMDDESHNCDMMGCSSVSHVVARVPRPPEQISAELASLRAELAEAKARISELEEQHKGMVKMDTVMTHLLLTVERKKRNGFSKELAAFFAIRVLDGVFDYLLSRRTRKNGKESAT